MNSHILLIFFLISLVLSPNRSVEGNSWKLSKEEDLEVERELKILNKQAIKTIQTRYGAIYDCVDFYQQPAFDHPKLKDIRYRFKLEPILSKPNDTWDQVSSEGFPKVEACPNGTVLIRRHTKDDLIRQRLAMKYTSYAANYDFYYYAIARTKSKPDRYSGASVTLDVCNPKVYERDYSSARVLLRNGPDSIEAGWKVDPYLNGDNWPYFYHRTTAARGAHCYKSLCSGFIVTTTTVAADARVTKFSQRGGQHYSQQVDIAREPNGDWKLRFGPNDKNEIGFWPKEIFADDGLAQMASYVDYGGEVFSEPYTPMPAMGIAYFPNTNLVESSFVSKLTYRNESGVKIDASDLELFSNSDADYKIMDVPNEHAFTYGGPGGGINTLI